MNHVKIHEVIFKSMNNFLQFVKSGIKFWYKTKLTLGSEFVQLNHKPTLFAELQRLALLVLDGRHENTDSAHHSLLHRIIILNAEDKKRCS